MGEGGSVLLLRGDYLYDERVVAALVRMPGVLLRDRPEGAVVAAHVSVERLEAARAVLAGARPPGDAGDLTMQTPESLAPAYQKRLRKHDPPWVAQITVAGRRALEDRLFSASYKGVTDLIPKWVWPAPARWATRVCARHRMHPTTVTCLALALVIAAGFLFARGNWALGLSLAWLMTFLDTVDGKLARVTVTSSEFGNVLDHGIDLIHPPLWYLAWGAGLDRLEPAIAGLTLPALLWVIVVGYVVGRLVEGAFHLWMGPFSIFLWRRWDSYFRLVTARRNPNLVLLTAGALAGRPDLGLLAVGGWTAVSTAILLVRLGMAARVRLASGPLRPWMLDVDAQAGRSLAVRLFVAGPGKP
jgi:phosphatidylglycerophosphate synthase